MASPDQTAAPPRQAPGALGPYLRAIAAHRVLVAATTLVALLAAFAWTATRSSEYEASATLLVTPLPQEDETFLGLEMIRDSGDPTRTVQTAATLVESNPAAARVAGKLDDGRSADDVLSAIGVNPVGESNVLAVTAKAEDADEAARLANLFAQASLDARAAILREQAEREIARLRAQQAGTPSESSAREAIDERIGQLETVESHGDPTLTLSERATPAASPTGTSAVVIVLLALIGGFALGSGAAVLLEMTRRQIRDEEEAAALFPIPILIRVPVLKRRGLRSADNSVWHVEPPVWEAFKTLLVQLDRVTTAGESHEGSACLVVSASAGDGKTTSAINLAMTAAGSGQSAVLLDFDLHKPDIGGSIAVAKKREVADLLESEQTLEELVDEVPGVANLSALALKSGESSAIPAQAVAQRLPQLIAEARTAFDLAVIDTAPLGQISDALYLLESVDQVLVVTRPGNTIRDELAVTRDLIGRSGHPATGLIILAAGRRPRSSYYDYGSAERSLFAPRPGTKD